MRRTRIFYDKKQKLKAPVMLVGLPGIGNVGSLVAEHIKNELGAKRFGILYSSYFHHQAIMLPNGGLRLISNRFYHCKNKAGKSILLLIGDTQPPTSVGQYAVNDRILKFFKSLGGKTIYTIGGYSATNQYVRNPKVFGVTNDPKLRKQLEAAGVVFGKAGGAIWGAAGLIPAMAKRQGIASACIMGETGMIEIDANAAKAVLERVKGILNIDLKMNNLDKIKQETEKLIKDMEEAAKLQEGPPLTRESITYIR